MKKYLLIIALALLPACGVTLTDDLGKQGVFSPNPLFLGNIPQQDDHFSLGFRDGCYNFVGQNGRGLHRMYDRAPVISEEAYDNALYIEGYKHGDRYCGVFVNKDIIL